MARFRFHKGSLADSLMTETEVNSLSDITGERIRKVFGFDDDFIDFKCEYYGADSRPEGYPVTYIVTALYMGTGQRLPLGFSDTMLE